MEKVPGGHRISEVCAIGQILRSHLDGPEPGLVSEYGGGTRHKGDAGLYWAALLSRWGWAQCEGHRQGTGRHALPGLASEIPDLLRPFCAGGDEERAEIPDERGQQFFQGGCLGGKRHVLCFLVDFGLFVLVGASRCERTEFSFRAKGAARHDGSGQAERLYSPDEFGQRLHHFAAGLRHQNVRIGESWRSFAGGGGSEQGAGESGGVWRGGVG